MGYIYSNKKKRKKGNKISQQQNKTKHIEH